MPCRPTIALFLGSAQMMCRVIQPEPPALALLLAVALAVAAAAAAALVDCKYTTIL